MTLSTITYSSNSYKSYVSVAEAGVILAADPVRAGTWDDLSDANKALYVIAATNRLDLLSWRGEKAGGNSQANEWPRKGLQYPDGTDVGTSEIPDALERATALLAGSIAATPAQADHGDSSQAISEIAAGSVSIKYFRKQSVVRGSPLQDETAHNLIRQWLATSAVPALGLASGTTDKSTFSGDRYSLTRGW